ncbi:uncharacterized protein [Watersipora subatra]|uniref:uncharacterized protein n=1 Tax=Watersipora subatra TaxID=2589382 RepID=UPI00355B3653
MAVSKPDADAEDYLQMPSEEKASEPSCAKIFAQKLKRFCDKHLQHKKQKACLRGDCTDCKLSSTHLAQCCLADQNTAQHTSTCKRHDKKGCLQIGNLCECFVLLSSLDCCSYGGSLPAICQDKPPRCLTASKYSLDSLESLKSRSMLLQNKPILKLRNKHKPLSGLVKTFDPIQTTYDKKHGVKIKKGQNNHANKENFMSKSLVEDGKGKQIDSQDIQVKTMDASYLKQDDDTTDILPKKATAMESQALDLVSYLKAPNEIKVSDSCFSVSSHDDLVYVGLSNSKGIDRIVNQSLLQPSFIPFKGPVWSVATDKEGTVYALSSSKTSWDVQICDTSNSKSTCWQTSTRMQQASFIEDYEYGTPALTCLGNKLVTANVYPKHVEIYSKKGYPCKSTFLYPLETSDVSICEVDDSSVIVSAREALTVSRVDIYTGIVAWCRSLKQAPGGVTCYANKYVIFTPAVSEFTTITILDAQTGKSLSSMMDPQKRTRSWVYSMCMADDTLVIPRCNERTVLFYKINWPLLLSEDIC